MRKKFTDKNPSRYKIIMHSGKELAGSEFNKTTRSHSFIIIRSYNKDFYITRFKIEGSETLINGIPITIFEN